jgi:PEP-CTERM putative exosortase interaction domain
VPTFTDPVTGDVYYQPDFLIGQRSNTSVIDFIASNNIRLATRQQVEALFADIGPYTLDMALNGYLNESGPDYTTSHSIGSYATYWSGAYFDDGNGLFGFAYLKVQVDPNGNQTSSSLIAPGNSTASSLSPDVGLWAFADPQPVPEPGTILSFGIGILGLVIFGRRRHNRKPVPQVL